MLILYTAQSCSIAGEVISIALCCRHWSYSPGERSKFGLALLVSIQSDLSQGLSEVNIDCPTVNTSWTVEQSKVNCENDSEKGQGIAFMT